MPKYSYRAKNVDGVVTQGTLRAASEDRAEALLKNHNLSPLAITPADESPFWQRDVFKGHVGLKDLIMFARQTASMINAGVPILESLQALHKQTPKKSFQNMLQEMAYDVEAGESLSNTMTKHPKAFSPVVLGIVRTGEASGRLSQSRSSRSVACSHRRPTTAAWDARSPAERHSGGTSAPCSIVAGSPTAP
jgi:type II secretory pathway component PulF